MCLFSNYDFRVQTDATRKTIEILCALTEEQQKAVLALSQESWERGYYEGKDKGEQYGRI